MFFRRSHINLLIIIALLGFSSCGGYEKLLKSTDHRLKYEKAMEYFENEEYVRAAGLFEQIVNIYRGTVTADTVYYYQARCYFMQRDYTLAGYHFKTLADNYPSSTWAEEAGFMNAYCSYRLSPRPSLDQTNTDKAITAFRLYLIKYPLTERRKEVEGYIAELQDKLVEKSYESGKLYYNLGEYKSSIIALQNSLEEYPDTQHREELMYLLLRSNYLLAVNSVLEKQAERYQAAIDEYYSFVGEFPESRYRNEADRMYNDSLQQIGGTDMLSQE